jgi:glycylpeptide N-tetradecanoyltransferase
MIHSIIVDSPYSFTSRRYFHRPINIPKLVDVKFTYVPRNMTLARMMRLNKLPPIPKLADTLREMTDKDIHQVHELYTQYMQRYTMAPEMSLAELRHHLLSGRGKGPRPDKWNGRREKQVVWAYVVEVGLQL